ncbi:Protein of unknown function (DUF3071) [Haloactinopolyspora alba]|uniref:DUF3071 domain-containing protein n=1 Tax=Haloactinopolyspora alba TaxID=648780 RepID=A0A2P8E2L2_9ACTN|nr:septation protein SepH [Haloactinopolyspora alba]PSL03714.1 Protein of unknown function (DUF3071) [Haloactinopolyspora alba]
MRELRLVAVSEDGEHLILGGYGDEQLALRVDDRLHAAIRGDRARLGQLDIQLESQLRPRDIQARVRAGESVDTVAAVSGMPREKVERFAGPVIGERQHVAERARQATVRRLGGDGPPQTLESAAAATASSHGTDPQQVQWDAWRRDDGRWLVRFSWDGEDGSALFSFDPSGRSVQPEDDPGRVIAGLAPLNAPEVDAVAHGPVDADPTDEPEQPAGPRLAVVESPVEDEPEVDPLSVVPPPVAAPVHELARRAEQAHDDDTDDTQPDQGTASPAARRSRRNQRNARADRRRREPELWSDPPADETADDEATSERLRLSDIASHVETDDTSDLAPTADQPASTPQRKSSGSSRSRRPSVPSWDEIMFGRRKND